MISNWTLELSAFKLSISSEDGKLLLSAVFKTLSVDCTLCLLSRASMIDSNPRSLCSDNELVDLWCDEMAGLDCCVLEEDSAAGLLFSTYSGWRHDVTLSPQDLQIILKEFKKTYGLFAKRSKSVGSDWLVSIK